MSWWQPQYGSIAPEQMQRADHPRRPLLVPNPGCFQEEEEGQATVQPPHFMLTSKTLLGRCSWDNCTFEAEGSFPPGSPAAPADNPLSLSAP